MRCLNILVPLIALAAPLSAEPGLPEEELVLRALDDHPSVVAARARIEAARARAEGLRKGPYEFSVQGTYQRRSVNGGADFDEYDAQLSRSFRLPGKARLDRVIGKHGLEVASNLAEDARHEAALLLASHWFDWLSAGAQERVDRFAVANYEKALAAVKRRRDLRDASQLEVDRAQAALSEARRTLEQSSGLAALSRSRLEVQFPGLALPVQPPEIAMPQIPDARLSQLGDLVVVNSHLIAAAEAQSARMAAASERAAADRMADPTVGLRLFSEFGGLERGAGVVISVPLGGGHRKAIANEAGANASAARAEQQAVIFNVQETAASDVTEARYRIAAWERSREAVEAQMTALAKLRRGQELGEIDLADLLFGERMAHDAFRIEAQARAEAMRAITKLRIDSHQLWLAD